MESVDEMLLRTDDPATLLDEVQRIAGMAGKTIRRIELAGSCFVERKPDTSALTEADLVANAQIVEALESLDRSVPVISEEGRCTVDGFAARRFWLVDPLDGTREFLAGNGEYTVNVALIEEGAAVLGVVHAPARGVTYTAVRGSGAFRIDGDGRQAIRAKGSAELVVVASRSHRGAALDAFLAALPAHRTTALGSSLKICMVAEGTAQLYPRIGPTSWWDTAAAHAVACEAGATITTLDGKPLRYDGTDVRNPSFVCASIPREIWAAAADAAVHAGG